MSNPDIAAARIVLEKEIEGLQALKDSLNETFSEAVDLVFKTKGRVVISGMGKSGHIARKIAATLASTGTPALFVHPGEASHGDLGMVTKDDIVVLLSNSGETKELGDIIEYVKRFSIPLIGVVRRASSTLVTAANIAFVLPEIPEASPTGAPTTSTTMILGWGDALAIALLEKRGFEKEDFHVFHPGGKLGSGLLKVKQIMRSEGDLPIVNEKAKMSEALIEMTSKSLGCTAVASGKELVGIITDGDLRRHIDNDITAQIAGDVMTKNPVTITSDALAVEAVQIMNERSITSLFVVDIGELKGVVHIHDLLREGVA
jgi:arabinose-5-phosphate isomerase